MSFQDFCEDEFNKKALELHKVSEILNDNWKISETNQKFYLSKKQTISIKSTRQKPPAHHHDDDDPSVAEVDQEDLIAIEYHVLFHPSYQVPCLYFNAYSGKIELFTNFRIDLIQSSLFRLFADLTTRHLKNLCKRV